MKKVQKNIVLFFIFILATAFIGIKNKTNLFQYPKYWPKPIYDFKKNPITEEGFQLGRHLFYDTILSRDNTISCASCHLQATGFTHVDHDLSHGIDNRMGTRNSLALMNLAWKKSFMWDGSINHLEVQALAPIESVDEMDESFANVIKKINNSKKYKKLYYDAFKDSIATGQNTLLALTQFELMLNSFNSKYDKYIRKENGVTFTEKEKNGLNVFRKNCASCHTEPLFTNDLFKNNGLPVDKTLNDEGRMTVTKKASDYLKFKVPTLRNIKKTRPYMHDGRFESLYEVVDHYMTGIESSKTLSQELKTPIKLSHKQKVELVAFLKTLTDYEFLRNPKFQFPKADTN